MFEVCEASARHLLHHMAMKCDPRDVAPSVVTQRAVDNEFGWMEDPFSGNGKNLEWTDSQ